jgi:hypothetical protein
MFIVQLMYLALHHDPTNGIGANASGNPKRPTLLSARTLSGIALRSDRSKIAGAHAIWQSLFG